MVTGVETAGLILGSIPLIIEGLKTYQKGIKSVKRSVKYDISLRKLIRRVEGQKLFFEDNLQKLLSDALSDSEDPIELGDDFWTGFSTGVINQAVKKYLGERKQQYFHDLLHEFERYFVKLGNALNQVQRAGKVSSKRIPTNDCNPICVIQFAVIEDLLIEASDRLSEESLDSIRPIFSCKITRHLHQACLEASTVPHQRAGYLRTNRRN